MSIVRRLFGKKTTVRRHLIEQFASLLIALLFCQLLVTLLVRLWRVKEAGFGSGFADILLVAGFLVFVVQLPVQEFLHGKAGLLVAKLAGVQAVSALLVGLALNNLFGIWHPLPPYKPFALIISAGGVGIVAVLYTAIWLAGHYYYRSVEELDRRQ